MLVADPIMNLLCFDFSSGGVTATIFNSRLESTRIAEHRWNLQPDERGAATLSAETVLAGFKSTIRELQLDTTQVDAISIGTFLHSLILVDVDNVPLTPVFTWLDSRGQEAWILCDPG
jgi:sugar (pentulose or hexulose) kinase